MEQLDEPQSITLKASDGLAGLPEEVTNAPLGPMIGVAAIALNMAMKYHDIATIQDGTLYQQYKMEGRNMVPLHMEMVFHTAMQIEEHLISANKRVARLMVAAALDDIEAEAEGAQDAPETPGEPTAPDSST